MSAGIIKVNDVELPIKAGSPVSFESKLVNRELAGIDLDFPASGKRARQMVDDLFKERTVHVDDPFTERSYEAEIRLVQSSFTDGSDAKYYVGELREKDTPPAYDSVRINGTEYQVLRSEEWFQLGGDEGVYRTILLKLRDDEFKAIQGLVKDAPVTASMERVGVDAEPFDVLCRGWLCWSEHQEDGQTYFKRVLRFFPPSFDRNSSGYLPFFQRFDALAEIALGASVRFEALLNLLAEEEHISQEQRTKLLSSDWRELLDKDRIEYYRHSVFKVKDAEEEFVTNRDYKG